MEKNVSCIFKMRAYIIGAILQTLQNQKESYQDKILIFKKKDFTMGDKSCK